MCHCRRLLDPIAVRSCAALLAEQADADIASGDAREADVASRIHRAINDPAQHHFDATIRYEDVLIAALHGHHPAV